MSAAMADRYILGRMKGASRGRRPPADYQGAPKRRRMSAPVKPARPRANARVGGFQGVEKKFVDVYFSDASLEASIALSLHDPVGDQLIAITQGAGENSRIGRQCTITNLRITGQMKMADEAGLGHDAVVRILIVRDKQTNNAQMTAVSVLQTGAPGGQGWQSYRNLEQVRRFDILYDKLYVLKRTAGAGNGTTNDVAGVRVPFKINLKLNDQVNYKDALGTVASVADVSYHLMAIASTPSFADEIELNYTVRGRFYG